VQPVRPYFSDATKKKKVLNNKCINYVITLTNKEAHLSILCAYLPMYISSKILDYIFIFFKQNLNYQSEYSLYEIYPRQQMFDKT